MRTSFDSSPFEDVNLNPPPPITAMCSMAFGDNSHFSELFIKDGCCQQKLLACYFTVPETERRRQRLCLDGMLSSKCKNSKKQAMGTPKLIPNVFVKIFSVGSTSEHMSCFMHVQIPSMCLFTKKNICDMEICYVVKVTCLFPNGQKRHRMIPNSPRLISE